MSYIVRSLTKSELEIYRLASQKGIVHQYWEKDKTVLSVILSAQTLGQAKHKLFG